HRIKNPSLHALPQGTGGRSSFNGIVATVFGSSGFLGRYVCNRLGKIGTQLVLPYRGDAGEMLRLKLVGDLGQVLFQPYSIRDDDSIRKAISYSNVVINLVGREWETKNFTFDDVHEHWPRKLAKMCREQGIEKLIHVSALNASEFPEEYMIKGGSRFLSSKWKGEMALKEEFPDAIIFKPSDIYGQEDRFLRYFCGLGRHQGKWMPLYKKGEYTVKQPIYVSDVAAGIVAACRDKFSKGVTYQAVGPKRYLLSELVDWFHRVMNKTDNWGYLRYDLRFDPFFQLRVTVSPYLTFGWPLGNLHWEKIEREAHSDVVVSSIPTLEDLGIELTHMENQVPWELKPNKAHTYYERDLSEFEVAEPPRIFTPQG
ncbi:hypothetical protein AAG570_012876, partial [Ranatra chinensis]